jgi:Flp pilus assembly secretin CpaC
MKHSSFPSSRSLSQASQITRAVRLAGLSCTALIALPTLVAHADRTSAKPAGQTTTVRGAAYNLAIGKTLQLQPVGNWSFRIEDGAEFVQAQAQDGQLIISPRRAGGRATIVVESAGHPAQSYTVRVIDSASTPPTVTTTVLAQAQDIANTPVPAEATPEAPATPAADATVPATAPGLTVPNLTVPDASATAPGSATDVAAPGSAPEPAPFAAPEAPAVPANTVAETTTAPADAGASLSPSLPAPSKLPADKAPFPTESNVPARVQKAAKNAPRNAVTVTAGLARLLQFQRNILAVFFSDVNVMDARAVNARTVAITGVTSGTSTLAVFTERFPGDAVGHANIYQISVRNNAQNQPTIGGTSPVLPADPAGVETAIRTALDDPRVSVAIIQLPGGTLAARLTGTVRDGAEIEAIKTTAGLFVPQVISSIYVDRASAALNELSREPVGTELQNTLRRVTENQSIEVLPTADGVILKAIVGSTAEADAILRLVPSKQRVTPFFVIRGANSAAPSSYYDAPRPSMSGEDAEITSRMQIVTGIRSVYAVRTGTNSLAVYGNVRSRDEYDTIKRYTQLLPQVKQDPGTAERGADGAVTPQGLNDQPINMVSAGFNFPRSIQMFVKITDESQSVLRKVTVNTNVVEINRNALKNLGVSFGSASVISEDIDPDTGQMTRQISPTTTEGTLLFGNGFGGTGGFSSIDPFRTRLNALYSKGNARILSSPNVTALDGAEAQIVVGGSRPIPVGGLTGQGGGVQGVIFRRYGIIMTMRPTLTSDDTILLQIRADVTNIDNSTSIVVGNANVPGETVRSVDTTLNVREGDIIVMGGLITNEHQENKSSIPILSKIPILGSLFTSKRFQNNETELAIFMTPTITRTSTNLNSITYGEKVLSMPPLQGVQEGGGINLIRDGNSGGQ